MIELYWILAGTLVLSGVMLGVYKSLWQVCGYSNPYLFGNPENSQQLGILPTAVIQTGLFVFLNLTSGLRLELIRNPFIKQDTLIFISITTGVGLLLSLQLTAIRHKPEDLRQLLLIGLSDTVIGAIAGGIFEGGPDIIEGGIFGAIIGLFEILFRIKKIFPGISDKDHADIFPLWIAAWIGGSIGGSFAAFASVIGALLAVMINYVLPSLVQFIGKFISLSASPMLILVRFKTILCNQCFRYTAPLRSRYSCGRRYCEHCQKQVEYTHDPGRLIVIFGDALPALEGRTFIFANPDFELPDHPVEISEIYIDTRVCDKRLLEKCITAILHDPPKYGRQSVKVFYIGKLGNLGDNLRNVLRNNFTHIEEFFPNPQQDKRLVLPSPVRGEPVEPSSSVRGEPVEPSSSVRGEPVEPQSPFDRLRANGERDPSTGLRANGVRYPSTEIRANPPSWRIAAHKMAGGVTGGILGALLGGFSFGLLAAIFAEMENSIALESQIPIGAFVFVWIALATLSGIRKGIQKYQSFARAAIPLTLFLLVLAAIAIPNLLCSISRSNRSRTAADMRAIGTALGSYQIDSNIYPIPPSGVEIHMNDEKEGIGRQLRDEGYYYGEFRDGWGQPFIYISDGSFYTLTSYGKDKKPGGKSEYGSDIIYVDGQFTDPSALVYK